MLRRWLDGGRPWRWAALLGFLLGLPSLGLGIQADDHLLRAWLIGGPEWAAFANQPWDLFHFFGDASAAEVIDRGLAPWWASPDAETRLLRPLSSLVHAAELSWWPDEPWLMHLHNLVWYGLLCALAALLYRRLLAGWAAGLATLFFVIDYTHGVALSWIANRNALIAGVFGLSALALHRRARVDGDRVAAWVAPLCLALAFAGGEVALAAWAYLVAYAVCLESGRALRRLATLWPYAAVGAVWAAVYVAGDFGVRDSGAYFDPLGQPGAYLAALASHGPLQLACELGGPVPDFWMVASPTLADGLLAMSVLTCVVAAVALAPLVRRDPVARFFALGAVLAVLPVCAAFPSSRTMLVPGFGLVGLVAQLVVGWRERAPWLPRGRGRRLLTAAFAVVAAGSHLVLSPPLLWLAQTQIDVVDREAARLDAGLPDQELTGRRLVIVNMPEALLGIYIAPQRATAGRALPRSVLWLGLGTHELELSRPEARALVVRDRAGFFGDGYSILSRSLDMPMPVGTVVELDGVTVEVLAAVDGIPTVVRFDFEVALESAALVWRVWDGDTLVPFPVPAVGETRTVPARPHPFMEPTRFF